MTARPTNVDQYIIPVEYSFIFTSHPFGITFKNSNNSVYVDEVDEKSAAHGHVVIGSKLIKIHNENVEGLQPSDIIKLRYSTKYRNHLPLLMTFRKPLNRSLSYSKRNPSKLNISIECNARALFLDINAFYKSWRTLPSYILLDTLLIFKDIHYERILKPNKNNIKDEYTDMMKDAVFKNLLQWKFEQGLLFTVDTKKKVSAFWKTLRLKLRSLSDPSTYNTSKYNALDLDINEYKKLDSFKYDVCLMDIEKEFSHLTLNVEAIKEILYRSNILLDIYDENGVVINEKVEQPSPCSFEDNEFDVLLDEITTVWNESSNNKYIE